MFGFRKNGLTSLPFLLPSASTRQRVREGRPRLETLEDRTAPAAGLLDPTFGQMGKVITDVGGDDRGSAMVRQADGKILVAGSTYNGDATRENFAVVRYTTSGVLDDTFGDRGKVITDLGGNDYGNALALQPDGKILVAGIMWNGDATGANFAVVRYTTSGVLDDTFGNDGKVVTDLSTFDSAYALALEPNGKILVAGYTRNNDRTGYNFALVRYFGWEVRPPVLRGQARQVTHVLGHTQVFRRVVSDWAYSPEELPLHYELIGAIPAGVTLSAHQQVLTYQRPANFHGDVQIRFRISDWVHQTQVVTVTLKERRVPVIPVAPVPLSPLEAALDQLRALATQLSARLGSLIPNTWPPR
ncbi:MAG: delta-60 repeat domain-containing protein [Gemmataceae bacterium]